MLDKIILPIIFEFGFWGVIVGLIIATALLLKKIKPIERILLFFFLSADIFLKYTFSFFAPIHKADHHIDIITNYYSNFLNGSFFSAPRVYFGSSGFTEYFFNKVLFLLGSFDIYYVYAINLGLSVFKGLLVFYITRLLFRNNTISFTALLIYIFSPLEIKIAATETQLQLSSVSILLFVLYLIKYCKSFQLKYLLLSIVLFVCCLFGRIDFGFLAIILFVIIVLYNLLYNKRFRSQLKDNGVLWIIVPVVISLVLLYVYKYFSGSVCMYFTEKYYLIGGRCETLFINNLKNLYKIFLPHYFFGNSVNPIPFFKSYFIPVYIFVLLQCSLLFLFIGFKRKREYIGTCIVIMIALVFIVLIYEPTLWQIRTAALIMPPHNYTGCFCFI